MKNLGKVYSNSIPKELEINASQVLIASNIESYEKESEGQVETIYKYDYVSYTKDEYIELLSNQNKQLSVELLDTQMALCDIYESLGG